MTNPQDEFPDSHISIAFYGSDAAFPTTNAKKSKLDFSLEPVGERLDGNNNNGTSVCAKHVGPHSTLRNKLDLKHEEDMSSCSSTASSPPATPLIHIKPDEQTFRIAIPTGNPVKSSGASSSPARFFLSSVSSSSSSSSSLAPLRPSFKRPSEIKDSPEQLLSSATKALAVNFVEAARTGNLDRLQELMKLHPEININSRVCEYTALHFAAFYGLTKMVKWLIENGADCEQKNTSGDTPLLLACAKGFPRCVLSLVKAGADATTVNKRGQSALFRAVHSGDLLTVKTLVEIGKVDLNWKNDQHSTALHEAAYIGFCSVAEYLISKGAPLDACNSQGRTPLHRACISGKTEIAQLLVDSGVDMDVQDTEGRSALHLAAFYNRLDIAAFLIKNLAAVSIVDHFNKTPKDVALSRGNQSLAKIF